jgi:hypothetical protein
VEQAHQSLNRLHKLKEFVKFLPFILLFVDLIWWVLSFWGVYITNYWIIGELFSHSLTFTLVMAFYSYVHKHCLYTWVCIIGLGLLNLLNIIYFFVNFEYYNWYAGLIILPCLIFSFIKWKQRQFCKIY